VLDNLPLANQLYHRNFTQVLAAGSAEQRRAKDTPSDACEVRPCAFTRLALVAEVFARRCGSAVEKPLWNSSLIGFR